MIKEKIAQIIPNKLKPFARSVYKIVKLPYVSVNNFRIRRIQKRLLERNYDSKTESLIVFLTPGYNVVTGGILAINSMYEETKKMKDIHNSEVILCTLPEDPLLLKYTKFNFKDYLYDFNLVLSYFTKLHYLMLHVPVVYVPQFIKHIYSNNKIFYKLKDIKSIHINILLMNIKNLPCINYLKSLGKIGLLTATTAHEAYTTPELRKKLGIPIHKLGVFICPEFYEKKSYNEKEDIMIVSPDPHPMKNKILSEIKNNFPNLKLIIIKNMPYEEYKKLIAKAKWSVTFGEGLDGYFIETIFSGGISFAVYNSDFFTEDFKSLRTVYDSYEEMYSGICTDLAELDDEKVYNEYQKSQYELVSKYYNYKQYIKNLELFYKGVYTYP